MIILTVNSRFPTYVNIYGCSYDDILFSSRTYNKGNGGVFQFPSLEYPVTSGCSILEIARQITQRNTGSTLRFVGRAKPYKIRLILTAVESLLTPAVFVLLEDRLCPLRYTDGIVVKASQASSPPLRVIDLPNLFSTSASTDLRWDLSDGVPHRDRDLATQNQNSR